MVVELVCREAAWLIAAETNVGHIYCNGKEHRHCIVQPEEGTRETVEDIKERGGGTPHDPRHPSRFYMETIMATLNQLLLHPISTTAAGKPTWGHVRGSY